MTSEITFLLNGEICKVSDIDPTTTLLNFLRNDKLLIGSKEGCGEGDCGACTVVIGDLDGDSVHYSALNACIQFVAMLHGKSVWTIEGVKGAAQTLHPVQDAFVKTHGTQCGFCTPGFVMSLFAAHLNQSPTDADEANDLFAGNLCRCTGYGSIVAAAENLHGQSLSDDDQRRVRQDHGMLNRIKSDRTVVLERGGRKFISPARADEFAAIYKDNPGATLVAGATDVGLWVTKQHRRLDTVIHLGRVVDFGGIDVRPDKIVIGAGVTLAEALPVLAKHIPDFGELLRRLGAKQVRNSGTVVGNIANGSPIGDTPPALMVLGARINLRKGGERRQIALEDFFIAYGKQDRAPGEFIESVECTVPDDPDTPRFYKISKRFDQDISALCGCFNIDVDNGSVRHARIAFGGMAATPLRALAVERALTGQPWTEHTITTAMAAFDTDFTPISDMRASADYRMRVAKNLLLRYFMETQHPLETTRLVGRGAYGA